MTDLIKSEPSPRALARDDLAQPVALSPPPPGSSDPDGGAHQLKRYLRILLRRKWLIVAILATVVAAALLQVFTATPMYRSTATLQIDPEDANVLPYEQFAGRLSQLQRGEYLWTQAEKLRTRNLAQRVGSSLDLANNESFNSSVRRGILLDALGSVRGLIGALLSPGNGDSEASLDVIADRLLGSLDVKPLRNTRLIQISYSSADPQLAAQVVAEFAEQFTEQHLESKYEATSRATEFLQTQLRDLKIRVEQSEEALLAYARAKNIVNYDQREDISRKKLADLSDEVTSAEAELIDTAARARAAEGAGDGSFPESLMNDNLRDLERRLSELEQQAAAASVDFGPEWPAVKELQRQVEQLRQQSAAEKAKIVDGARQEYGLALDRQQRLTMALAEQRTIVDRLNEDSIQYNILQREVESNKGLYEGLLQRLKEAGVAAGLKSSNVQLADAATVPRFASSPAKGRALSLALVMGLLLGVGGAFIAEALDSSLRTPDDVTDSLGLPALGVIPHFDSDQTQKLRLLPKSTSGRPVTETAVAEQGSLPAGDRIWEAYRSLRTSLLLSSSEYPPKTVLVTSALPGEGKSTTAANLGIVLARNGAQTVLVDLDMRRPSLAQLFGVDGDPGMSTYLSGNAELPAVVQPSRVPNLYVLPGGSPAPDPTELIGSRRMLVCVQQLARQFTHVVFDSPPFLGISDALILARNVDGVVLVARAGETPRESIRRAVEQLRGVGGKLLGVVINDADLRHTFDSYYGVYGSDYDRYFSET